MPALGPKSPLVRGSPSGAKEKVSTRALSPVLPPLPGLDRRLGLVSQGLRPGLSSIARYAGWRDTAHLPAASPALSAPDSMKLFQHGMLSPSREEPRYLLSIIARAAGPAEAG